MKKILIVICMIMPMGVWGATMCATNDTVSVVLDPSVSGNNYGYSQAYSTWWASFPYGRISGISACLSSNYGKSMGGYVSQLTDTDINTGDTVRVVGGEENGLHCWCKMTHPAVSLWVFNYSGGSLSDCVSGCARSCGAYAQRNSALRGGLFGSVRN